MFARHVTLGRVVIVLGGVLVLVALISHFAMSGARAESPLRVSAMVAGVSAVAFVLVLAGRRLGGWAAARLGREKGEGRRAGLLATLFLLWVAINVWRQFAGG